MLSSLGHENLSCLFGPSRCRCQRKQTNIVYWLKITRVSCWFDQRVTDEGHTTKFWHIFETFYVELVTMRATWNICYWIRVSVGISSRIVQEFYEKASMLRSLTCSALSFQTNDTCLINFREWEATWTIHLKRTEKAKVIHSLTRVLVSAAKYDSKARPLLV